MKRTLISVLAVMLALWPTGADAQNKRTKMEKPEIERPEIKKPSKKPPEGAIVQGNKITLKSGYQFVKQSDNTVAVENTSARKITGGFSCSCAVLSGACTLSITKDGALCGGCSDCRLVVVIDPVKATTPKNAPGKKAIN